MESSLRKALELKELVLFYQPKVKVATNTIDGVEALVRWNSNQGLISPLNFIPLAEETGLIVPFGEWILNEACSQLKKWQQEGKNGISMAVNLSAKQFAAPDFFPMVQRIVSQSGIDPRFLKLELTESLLLGDIEKKIIILQNLRDIGLKISVDDFGTGYSSLSYLSKLPLDELKIDKSFIDNVSDHEDSRAIVSTIIYLARKLRLQTVAEGIETPEQLEFLQQEGCDLYQGYLFSKPVSSAELSQLLTSVKE
jgi:EAL domain-containing protein (putative c-di-GMP-specific phosphodiesterase class I)